MIQKTNFHVLGIFLVASGCGGGGGSNLNNNSTTTPEISTAVGRFIDSPVSGLSYSSGGQVGTTGVNGEFTYELHNGVPQLVSFGIGSLSLGSVAGGDIVTPFDITNSASHEINVATLLLALDTDSNPENGIEISQSLVSSYGSFDWSNVDLSPVDALSSYEVSLFLSDIASVTQSTPQLQVSNTVEDHLTETHRCISSGNYFGEYSGGEKGPVVIGVDPHTGKMSGVGWSKKRNTGFVFPIDQQVLTKATQYHFSITTNDVTANEALTFDGKMSDYSLMFGTWSSQNLGSGNFSLSKINKPGEGAYFYTGAYLAEVPGTGDLPIGAFSFSVKSDNSVVGEVVNIVVGTSEISALSGNVNGSTLTLNSTNGISFEGIVDLGAKTYTGNWSSSTGFINSGTFKANGC